MIINLALVCFSGCFRPIADIHETFTKVRSWPKWRNAMSCEEVISNPARIVKVAILIDFQAASGNAVKAL